MSDIIKFIKNKLKGSTTMPAGTGKEPNANKHAHDDGCCGGCGSNDDKATPAQIAQPEPEHKHDSTCGHDHNDDEDDNTSPGGGCGH